jgi:hypothetical protein
MAIFTMRMRKLSLYALTILMLTLLSCGNQRRGSVNIGDSGFSLERGTPISEGHTLSATKTCYAQFLRWDWLGNSERSFFRRNAIGPEHLSS